MWRAAVELGVRQPCRSIRYGSSAAAGPGLTSGLFTSRQLPVRMWAHRRVVLRTDCSTAARRGAIRLRASRVRSRLGLRLSSCYTLMAPRKGTRHSACCSCGCYHTHRHEHSYRESNAACCLLVLPAAAAACCLLLPAISAACCLRLLLLLPAAGYCCCCCWLPSARPHQRVSPHAAQGLLVGERHVVGIVRQHQHVAVVHALQAAPHAWVGRKGIVVLWRCSEQHAALPEKIHTGHLPHVQPWRTQSHRHECTFQGQKQLQLHITACKQCAAMRHCAPPPTLKLALTTSSICRCGGCASGKRLLRGWPLVMSSSVDAVLVHAGRSRNRCRVATTAPGEPDRRRQQQQQKQEQQEVTRVPARCGH